MRIWAAYLRRRSSRHARAWSSTSALLLTVSCAVAFFSIFALPNLSAPASASESVTYCYDALGRLTQVGKTGGPASGKSTDTSYDPAGNRSNQTTATGTVDCNDPTGAGGTGGGSSGGGGSGPSFSIGDASGTEGDTLVFTVTKTGTTSSSYSLNYATANGTAGTADYTAVSGTLTFGPTETTKTVSVVTKTDIKIENTEVFYVNLSGATGGATISDAQGAGSIFDDANGCPTC